MADYDIIGSIAIIKSENKSRKEKLRQADFLLKRGNVKTVVEKASDVRGRLRTIKINHIKGEKNSITLHKENDCNFLLDIKTCYFSPRISGERKLIAEKIKSEDNVLVMFAGIGVYPIVIYKYKKPKKIVGIELGKDCCKYFKENLKLNKVPENKIQIIQGDVKKKINGKEKYDVVIMSRPNLKESFLKYGLKASKKGTKIFYYAFCHEDKLNQIISDLKKEAINLKRKISIGKIVKAGNIAPGKYRYRIEMKVIK